jgi:hypothetical protein
MINEGKHRARAVAGSAQFGRASTGTEQIAVTFEFLDERMVGQEITWIGNFANEQGTEITLKGLLAAGWATDDLSDLTGLGDTEVQLVIEHEKGTDNVVRAKVRWVNKAGGGFAFKDAMSEGGVMGLAERVRGHAMKLRQASDNRAPVGRPAPARPARITQRLKPGEWDGTGADPHGDDLPDFM